MPYDPSPEARRLIDELVGPEGRAVDRPGKPLPLHVAVIMDGNGRWAQERGLPRIEGHRAGIESVRSVARACRKIGIPYLTLYAFSSENWKRPRTEIAALMKLLRNFLKLEIPEMVENEIRLASIGDLDRLPLYVRNQMAKTKTATRAGGRMQLTLALSYGSRAEIARAAREIARKVRTGALDPSDITPDLIGNHLDTRGTPDPDLLIRTSGEMRISNFLLWQIAYAEIYVTDVLWPDFRDLHFYRSILEYLRRERRYGGVRAG